MMVGDTCGEWILLLFAAVDATLLEVGVGEIDFGGTLRPALALALAMAFACELSVIDGGGKPWPCTNVGVCA